MLLIKPLMVAFAASLTALWRSSLYGAVRRKERRPFSTSNSMQPVSGSATVCMSKPTSMICGELYSGFSLMILAAIGYMPLAADSVIYANVHFCGYLTTLKHPYLLDSRCLFQYHSNKKIIHLYLPFWLYLPTSICIIYRIIAIFIYSHSMRSNI